MHFGVIKKEIDDFMRYLFIPLLVIIISGCGLFLPDSLEGDIIPDSALGSEIFINEVSADNPNEDDWVELYNNAGKIRV